MQKKRPQAPTAAPLTPATSPAPDTSPVPVARGRAKRVRSRLVVGVAVVGLIVVGAGTPGVLATSTELHESQRLVTLAQLNRQAVTLAHSLADERDEVTAYIAAGRERQKGSQAERRRTTDTRSARVDRQIDEIRGSIPDDRAGLRRELATVPSVRRTALTGDGTALEAHRSYTAVITHLHALADELTEKTPPRAADGTRAPAALGLAVEQASATRGLLVAALSMPRPKEPEETVDSVTRLPVAEERSESDKAAERTRDSLSALAQQSRVRELAALSDFDQAADKEARDSLAATVTGAEVKSAESYLTRLTDQPVLSESDLTSDRDKLESSLTSRIEQMRGVESSLASERITALEQLRDDDVTALEVRIGVLGGLLLLAVAVLAALLRTITRPLAVLRIGAARLATSPETGEPVGFTGRNDEFAQVVRSLNALHAKVLDLGARAARPEHPAPAVNHRNAHHPAGPGPVGPVPAASAPAAPTRAGTAPAGGVPSGGAPAPDTARLADELAAQRADLAARSAAERAELTAELAAERAETRRRTDELTAEIHRLRHAVDHTFVNLSLRTLGLVERQLGVIEKLEEREQDPDRLATLFKLDHMATVMRRHSENLLVLAGVEHSQGHPGAVPLVDVLRAAVSEIERYERVVIQSLPPHAQVAGFAADDLSHLVAELLENATSFSPPDARVELSGWLLESGEVMLSVQDNGIGMPAGRIAEFNERLENPAAFETPSGREEGLGLRVTALLAARHGVRVQLRDQRQGGITSVVVLPQALLPKEPPAEIRPAVPSATPPVQLPGSAAEANSNTLPGGPRHAAPALAPAPDPLVEAAEAAVRAAEPEPDAHGRTADGYPEDTAATGYGEYQGYAGGDETTFEMRLPDLETPPAPSVPGPSPAYDALHRHPVGPDAVHPEAAPAAPADPTATGHEPWHRDTPHHQPGQHRTGPHGPGPYASAHHDTTPHDTRPHDTTPREAAPYDTSPHQAPHATTPHQGTAYRPGAGSERAGAPVPDGPLPPTGPVNAPVWDRVTDKGLPKRTPRVVKPAPARGERTGSVDAEALRRRLGGFQQAAEEGRREAEAEIARTAGPQEAGDTVEEARS
ncbi:nitrate- and nitrite sensing domain-containing protein [Streptomyces sp. NPDC004609]|uniref:sensor histidine kinase n=1 Tax=Streptomyces sp. NPDC004609 TaxID=3364704 RepID=UPI003698D579